VFRKVIDYLNLNSDEFISERSLDAARDLAKIKNKGSDKLKELLVKTAEITANLKDFEYQFTNHEESMEKLLQHLNDTIEFQQKTIVECCQFGLSQVKEGPLEEPKFELV
jgi:hypothetical protein